MLPEEVPRLVAAIPAAASSVDAHVGPAHASLVADSRTCCGGGGGSGEGGSEGGEGGGGVGGGSSSAP